MKAVRINVTNLKQGDVFEGFAADGRLIVRRPLRNMNRKYRLEHRKRITERKALIV